MYRLFSSNLYIVLTLNKHFPNQAFLSDLTGTIHRHYKFVLFCIEMHWGFVVVGGQLGLKLGSVLGLLPPCRLCRRWISAAWRSSFRTNTSLSDIAPKISLKKRNCGTESLSIASSIQCYVLL